MKIINGRKIDSTGVCKDCNPLENYGCSCPCHDGWEGKSKIDWNYGSPDVEKFNKPLL